MYMNKKIEIFFNVSALIYHLQNPQFSFVYVFVETLRQHGPSVQAPLYTNKTFYKLRR